MSATRILLALLFALPVLAPKLAVAQPTYYRDHDSDYYRDYYRNYPRITYRSHPPVSYGFRYRYDRAAVIRATSQAWINQQEAYGMYLANRGLATRAYFENRAANRMYRSLERGPRPTREQLERIAKAGAPERLSPSELDPATGAITWPMALAEPKFQGNRQQIEAFFRQRSRPDYKPSIAAAQDVLMAIGQMRAKLKNQIHHLDPGYYVVARKFLDSLTQEVRRRD